MAHVDTRNHPDQHGHGGHDKHAGHDPAAFRRKFWLSLALTVPIVATSHMVMDWLGYELDFSGIGLVGPVLGTVVFGYGGWPFLQGAVREIRDRAPGMMLLIAMAITVAYVASLATSFGAFDLDFWWELAALVTIMLLGHWQEMKAIGQARGACRRSPRCCPTTPSGSTRTGHRSGCRWPNWASVTWSWSVRVPGCRPTAPWSTVAPRWTSR